MNFHKGKQGTAAFASDTDDAADRDPLTVSEGLDLVGILSAIDETAYVWDAASDRFEWESNAATILGVKDDAAISTGKAFESLIAAEHISRRTDAIAAARSFDHVRGVPYRIRYRFLPLGKRSGPGLDLEDHGRWWPDASGRPERARGVIRVMTDRYLAEQQSLFRSDYDELTGQLNRIRLTEALAAVLSRNEQTGHQAGFLMVAVNNLAVINETFGYEIGDEVVAAVARRLKSKLRGGDVIGRYSSNKFGIIVQDCGAGALGIAAARFLKLIRDDVIKTPACQIQATISIGGVVLPEQAASVADATNFALRSLEKAKAKRHECYVPYEANVGAELARTRNQLIADSVMSAIDEQRMRLVLQPLVGAKSAKPEIYECLLRMEKPDGSLVSAGEFIPIAEQLGLSRLIDRRTLELSVELLKRHPDLKLSVNVSGLTCSDHEWLASLYRLTGGRADMLSRMIIEITETAAIEDIDQSISFVDTLKEMGCKVAIDDFGAGYTSFKHLKMLNVDMVKIDGAFVKNLTKDTSDQIFIKTMIELAKTFNLETVAEWVGDEPSVDHLVAAGITYLQGYYYGMPIDAADYGARAQSACQSA